MKTNDLFKLNLGCNAAPAFYNRIPNFSTDDYAFEDLRTEWKQQEKIKGFCVLLENTLHKNLALYCYVLPHSIKQEKPVICLTRLLKIP